MIQAVLEGDVRVVDYRPGSPEVLDIGSENGQLTLVGRTETMGMIFYFDRQAAEAIRDAVERFLNT